MSELPKISIITPTLNSEKDLEACVLSVAGQTYENKEHLIIDGKSTDNTIDIIKKYAEKYPHLRWISEKDGGIYEAMNKGVDMAGGEWVYFLGSDDVFFDNNVLESLFNNQTLNDLDLVYGNVLWGNTGDLYAGKFSTLKLMQKNICHQAIFLKKELFKKIGNFDTKYKALADYVFNIKWFSDESIKYKYIKNIIAKYNPCGHSSSHKDIEFLSDRDSIIDKYFPKEYGQLNKELQYLAQKIQQMDRKIAKLNQAVQQKDQEINFVKSSKFWKIREKYIKLKIYGK